MIFLFKMTTHDLIRLLLAVRQMNTGQFWALLRKLGASDALPPEPMGEDEIEELAKKMKR